MSVFHSDAHWLGMDSGSSTGNAAGADEADAASAASSSSSSAAAASASAAPQPMRWFPLELLAPVRAKGKKTQDRFRERMAARTKLDGSVRHQQIFFRNLSPIHTLPTFHCDD